MKKFSITLFVVLVLVLLAWLVLHKPTVHNATSLNKVENNNVKSIQNTTARPGIDKQNKITVSIVSPTETESVLGNQDYGKRR